MTVNSLTVYNKRESDKIGCFHTAIDTLRRDFHPDFIPEVLFHERFEHLGSAFHKD